MTVGFYSPLPPERTGVADYSASLLAALRRHGTVEVAPRDCDVPLYHIGNNRMHAAIYERALARPGVVVLHDAVLHHFLLGHLDEAAYVEEFVYNYGEWRRGEARDLWRGRANAGVRETYFEHPMLRRIVEHARTVIVHNAAAGETARRHAPGNAVHIVEIPHLFDPPLLPGVADALRWRQQHGIAPGAYLFGVFGFLRESKRLASVLDAFTRLRREVQNVALLVAGDFVSTDLARALAGPLTGRGIVRVPYVPEHEFWLAAQAVDACINLRYPGAGETSGIAIRLMGLGKPVLVTDAREASSYPEDACVRIEAGVAERDSLWHAMVLLTSNAEVSRQIGGRARLHITRRHSVETVAAAYWTTLCESRH